MSIMPFQVSIVETKDDVASALARALGLLKWTPLQGETYLIKPNMLNAKTSEQGVTTDPRIVKALATLLLSAGNKTFVGDSPGNAYPGKARSVFIKTGMMDALVESGAEFIDFEESPPKIVDTKGELIKQIGLGSAVFEHRLINVAKLKTHLQTKMTGAIKNLAMGCIQGSGKAAIHKVGKTKESMAKAMIDVYAAIRPQVSINIMDAIVCMEGNGPSSGRVVKLNKLLASKDALALDMVSFKMAGVTPEDVPHIREAIRRGFGPKCYEEIEILGDPFKPVKFQMAATFFNDLTLFAGSYAVTSLGPSVYIDYSNCTNCGECAGICPVKAITLESYPTIEKSKCIKCYACHEVCENKAVKIKKSRIS